MWQRFADARFLVFCRTFFCHSQGPSGSVRTPKWVTQSGYTDTSTSVQDMVTGNQAGSWSAWPWRVRKLHSFKTSGTNQSSSYTPSLPTSSEPSSTLLWKPQNLPNFIHFIKWKQKNSDSLKNVGYRIYSVHDIQFLWQSGLWLQMLSVMPCVNLHGKAKTKIER